VANYFAQTVAHNCVVVHQPGEPPARYWGGTVAGNHGGQHRALGSIVRAFETRPDYVYVAGDATASYLHGAAQRPVGSVLDEKVSHVTRQLVFLPPSHLVIFDRVTATRADYRKDWLLHTAHKPLVSGNTVRADHGQGRMFCRTLLPTDARLTLVGGPGGEFQAAGQNWPLTPNNLQPSERALMGQWRVEVTPGAPRSEDRFLHVIQVGGQDRSAMDEVAALAQGDRVGARVRVGRDTWQVLFNSTGPLGGRITRIGHDGHLDKEFTAQVQRQTGILAHE